MLRRARQAALGLWTLLGCLGLQGCEQSDGDGPSSTPQSSASGGIGLNLSLPEGSDVNEMSYAITRAGTAPRNGTIPVISGHARLQIGNLPVGEGYTIRLEAQRDAAPPCEGSATFLVVAGATTKVTVSVQCGSVGRSGNVSVDGTLNYCPDTPTLTAAPSAVPVGRTIAVTAVAQDENPVSYAWSAPLGTFAAPSRASTTFTCTSAGNVTLTVHVSDNQGCNDVVGTIDVACTEGATFSSQSAYVVPVTAGVVIKAILSSGDSPSAEPNGPPYRMVGIPAGLGAYDNGDGTFTLLSNHELGTSSGSVRAHGGKGAFVSRWTVRKSDLGVLEGADLMQTVNLWNSVSASYVAAPGVAFARFGSADLPAPGALSNAANGLGFDGRLFFDGEDNGSEGRVVAHGMDGVSYDLPRLGKASWEDIALNPVSQPKTVTVQMDDSTPGQVYVYVGTKTSVGLALERAGLANGILFGVTVAGFPTEPAAGIPTSPFTLSSLGDVTNATGDALETASNVANVTRFNRPGDGSWDPAHPNDFYFVTTNAIAAPSRLWRLRFQDIGQPELGGSIEMMLNGSEGQAMLANIAIDARGHILLQEDPGDNARIAQIWRYDIATDALVNIAQHDPARFTSGAAGFITQAEAASGIIDASAILGAGWWLSSDQVHASADAELVELGQYFAIYDPGTL